MRREYSRIAGVESVDTMITGATVKLKAGNNAALERFWMIADKLSTEPQEAHVVVAGRLLEKGKGYLLEVSGPGRTYTLKPNSKLAANLEALVGQRVIAHAGFTILSEKKVEVRLRKLVSDSPTQ